MPLASGKSKQAFQQNVRTEVAAGRPQKQAVAIAYSQQRKSKADDHAAMTPPFKKRGKKEPGGPSVNGIERSIRKQLGAE